LSEKLKLFIANLSTPLFIGLLWATLCRLM